LRFAREFSPFGAAGNDESSTSPKQAYNEQIAVDSFQLIVGQAVTQETNDKKQLLPMITVMAQQSGETPTQLLADAGYCSEANLTASADTSIDPYMPTSGLCRPQ
jgi:hypothetical protein